MFKQTKRLSYLTASITTITLTLSLLAINPINASPNPTTPSTPPTIRSLTTTTAVKHDVSPPLTTIEKQQKTTPLNKPSRPTPTPHKPNPNTRINDILNTTLTPPTVPPVDPTPPTSNPTLTSFDGIWNILGYYPPDTDGDVGPTVYIQMVNSMFAIYDKTTGETLAGPLTNNAIFSGFGGACQTDNDGDPIVQYDQYADRWLISQFAVSSNFGTGPYSECVAVSTTNSPFGTWNRYEFQYTEFPDYPKIGVWPDGYYVSYNMFNTAVTSYVGVKMCALDRAAMIAGATATQQCFTRTNEFGMLPSDAYGTTPPPVGAPNYFVGEHWSDNTKLTMYRFHTDWATPANTTLEGPIEITVDPYVWACIGNDRTQCIPQKDTTVKLESLGGRAMYRLGYRNFGTHQSLTFNHTVATDGQITSPTQTGMKWYELRDLNNTPPTVYQDGLSYDSNPATYRWTGSMAMDKKGNIAVGYSSSSATEYPSIRYTGRLATDPIDTMPQGESVIINGTGSQTGVPARWGDYSSMQVDPVDDCTFWYTNEYLATTSTNSWRTRIASFKFPGCNGPTAPQNLTTTSTTTTITAKWEPPADTGGTTITGYTVIGYNENNPSVTTTCTTSTTLDPNPLTCTLTGLTPSTYYMLSLTANTVEGTGNVTTKRTSTLGLPTTVPDPPQNVTASPGNGQATINWNAPNSDGGTPITSYIATTHTGNTCMTTTTTCTITGLFNGNTYTVTVTALNANGTSQPSLPATVTPSNSNPTSEPTYSPPPTSEPTPTTQTTNPLTATVTSQTVEPNQNILVTITNATIGCQLTTTFDTQTITQTNTQTGTTITLTAPLANKTYPLTITQTGTPCGTETITIPITVEGPYITGNTTVKTNTDNVYKAYKFTPNKKVKWQITSNTVTFKETSKTNAKGTTKVTLTFPRKGTYTIKATQKNNKYTITVKVKKG